MNKAPGTFTKILVRVFILILLAVIIIIIFKLSAVK